MLVTEIHKNNNDNGCEITLVIRSVLIYCFGLYLVYFVHSFIAQCLNEATSH